MRSPRALLHTLPALLQAPLLGVCCGLGVFLGAGASAQEDAARTAERFLAYLREAPYHESAFARFLEACSASGGTAAAIAELESEPDDPAARVLLARLHAARGEPERARALLGTLDDPDARLALLRAQLELELGDSAAALTELERAAGAERQLALDARRDLGRRRARLLARLERPDEASAVIDALGALEPRSVGAQLEAGALAEELELADAALTRYAAAERAARDDVAGRANALVGRARLLERVGRDPEALAAWDATSELVARGHWLREELDGRRIELRARDGSLTAWITELSARTDLASRELLARALAAAGEPASALTELRAARREYPGDLDLARRLLALAREHASPEELVGDLERALDAHPHEPQLAFELGVAQARCGRITAARVRLESWVERRPDEAEACLRVARAFAGLGVQDEAAFFIARAAERASRDLALLEELAEQLDALDRPEDRGALFASAFELRAAEPDELAALAALHVRRDEVAEADRCLTRALELAPDDPALLEALADLRATQGRHDEAFELWRGRLDLLEGEELVQEASTLAGRIHARERVDDWVARENERLDAAPPALAGAWLLSELHARRRALASAVKVLRQAALGHPDDLGLRRRLVSLLRDKGELAGAIKEARALLEVAPGEQARTWLELAQLQARPTFRRDLEESLTHAAAAAGDDAALLVEIGRLAQREREHGIALEVFARAVESAPGDAAPRLALASELFTTRRTDEGADALVAGWRRSAGVAREHALMRILGDLERATSTALAEAGGTLAQRLEARPGDVVLAQLSVEVVLRGGDQGAFERLETLVSPAVRADPDFALSAALGHARGGDRERALEALDHAVDGDASIADERRLELVRALGALGCRERALELALDSPFVLEAAKELEETLGPALARELLEAHVVTGSLGTLGWARLGELRAPADPRAALDAWARHEELHGGRTWKSALAIAELARAVGENQRADEACTFLAEFAVERSGLRLAPDGVPDAWPSILCAAARTRPRDAALIALAVEAACGEQAVIDESLALLARLAEGAEELAPEGIAPEAWRRRLLFHERKLLRAAPDRAARRRAELDESRAAKGGLRSDQWAQRLWLARGAADASTLAGTALTDCGPDPLVLAAAARTLESSGDMERALALVERAVSTGAPQEDPERLEALAEALAIELAPRSGSHERSPGIARLAAASIGPPDFDRDLPRVLTTPEALRTRARLCAALGQPELAGAALDALERCRPHAPTLTLARACLEAGRYERAAEHLTALKQEHHDALQALEKSARGRALEVRERTWQALIETCIQQGDPQRAWALARAAPDAELTAPWSRGSALAEATHAELARELDRVLAGEEGVDALRAAAAQLVELELALERWPESLATLQRVAPALPTDSWPGDLAAPLAAALGDSALAVEMHRAQLAGKGAERFVAQTPISVWPARVLTLELPEPMRLEAALEGRMSRLALRLNPLVKSARYRDAGDPLHNHLGLLHLALAAGDVAEAAAVFEALAAAEPEWLGARALGMARVFDDFELAEHAERVLGALHRAAERNGPAPLELADAYARALMEAERYDELDTLIVRQLAAREPRPRDVEDWAADWRLELEFGGR